MTVIYHITHVNNLEQIIRCQGLWCDAQRVQQAFSCIGIAHQDLKNRRARTIVRAAVRGTLADYVPFYFANRSPMLYSIHTGFVEGYDSGQTSIIYLVSSVEQVVQGNRPWCFTNGHAVEAMTDFFDDVGRLDQVDWPVIDHWSWKNTEEDPDRKRRKQAEFLVHQSFPWSWVESIGVINAQMEQKVAAILANVQHQPPIEVRPNWFY
jgi:hypothetical protein